jgi:myo-inositol 2-dehydrogenase / D-chiro-inositol 1-dehydrogenase
MKTRDSRRNFVKSAAGAAAAAFTIVKPHQVRGAQANSAMTLGLIGCGNRGMYVSGIFAKNENARVAAYNDIYEDRFKAAAEKYSGAKRYNSMDDMLNDKSIDAVLIATPAFLHPEHFERAVKAKKHIFLEKPAGVDAAGCLRVTRAAKMADPTKRISMDYQQRYGTEYRKAHQIVKSGELGRILQVRAAWMGGGPPIKTGHPADQERIRNWFFYRELSGDILIEQDCHNIDVVNWFMGTHPIRVSGSGARMSRTQIGDIYDSLACTFQFEDGTIFSYTANQFGNTVGYSDVSETFVCEKGSVNVSRRGYKVYRQGKPVEEVETKYDITQDNVNQFVEGVRTGKMENAALWGAESSLVAVMALTACTSGQPMTWEKVNQV